MSALRPASAAARSALAFVSRRSHQEGLSLLGDGELLTLLLDDPCGHRQRAGEAASAGTDVRDLLTRLRGGVDDETSFGDDALGETSRLRAEAALELGRRAVRQEALAAMGSFPSAQEVARWAHAQVGHLDHEEIWLLALNVRHGLVATRKVAQGGMSGCTTSTREILRCALRVGAASFLLVHNHPSGDPTPSMEDARMTRHVSSAAEIVGVPLLDHVVVGGGAYVSLFDLGLIAPPRAPGGSPRRRTRGTSLRVPHV